ncbi:MAG TPA: hypothetical protein VMW41_04085 [Candidatus Bathyarchaeia archaeon]|nr:hypothetical protein [Candidatus Bathyarchaeia archaeon]
MKLSIVHPHLSLSLYIIAVFSSSLLISLIIKKKSGVNRSIIVILGSFFFSLVLSYPFLSRGLLYFSLIMTITILSSYFFNLFKEAKQKILVFLILLLLVFFILNWLISKVFCVSLMMSYPYKNRITGQCIVRHDCQPFFFDLFYRKDYSCPGGSLEPFIFPE